MYRLPWNAMDIGPISRKIYFNKNPGTRKIAIFNQCKYDLSE